MAKPYPQEFRDDVVAVARRGADGRRPWLTAGDVVEVEITGLGRQRNELA